MRTQRFCGLRPTATTAPRGRVRLLGRVWRSWGERLPLRRRAGLRWADIGRAAQPAAQHAARAALEERLGSADRTAQGGHPGCAIAKARTVAGPLIVKPASVWAHRPREDSASIDALNRLMSLRECVAMSTNETAAALRASLTSLRLMATRRRVAAVP